MDEKEYLKRKKEIEYNRIGGFISIIAGCVFLTYGIVFHLTLPVFLMGRIEAFAFLIVSIGLSTLLIILGLYATSKARDLEIELEVYDKKRERRKAQKPIHPATAEPTAQLQYCPSCGKKLQPDWKVCGYCGKKLKKSD